jgi:peptidyl-prolyl cis-trans isomerase B (cyclophilin B)
MVLGILGISIAAIVLGHVSLDQIKKSGDAQEGRGFAIAGLVLGYIGLALSLILVVAFILW